MQYQDKVYFVVNTSTGARASQYYSRFGDAVNKAKKINRWIFNGDHYVAVTAEINVEVKED
jgi:hypothetical protein